MGKLFPLFVLTVSGNSFKHTREINERTVARLMQCLVLTKKRDINNMDVFEKIVTGF